MQDAASNPLGKAKRQRACDSSSTDSLYLPPSHPHPYKMTGSILTHSFRAGPTEQLDSRFHHETTVFSRPAGKGLHSPHACGWSLAVRYTIVMAWGNSIKTVPVTCTRESHRNKCRSFNNQIQGIASHRLKGWEPACAPRWRATIAEGTTAGRLPSRVPAEPESARRFAHSEHTAYH
jgi:hypothetical protein